MDQWLLELVFKYHGYGIAVYVLITCLIACCLGFAIGLERQLNGEPAGIRTHALLALGCSLLMSISIWAIRVADGSLDIVGGSASSDLNYDTSRIAAGVVTGIGFLGAGVIIKDKFTVRGLSTAATLWICSAIGRATGAGFVLEAIIATGVTIIVLLFLNKLISLINSNAPSIIIIAKNDYPITQLIKDFSENNGIVLKYIKILDINEEYTTTNISFAFATDKKLLEYLCNQFRKNEEIKEIYVQVKIKGTNKTDHE